MKKSNKLFGGLIVLMLLLSTVFALPGDGEFKHVFDHPEFGVVEIKIREATLFDNLFALVINPTVPKPGERVDAEFYVLVDYDPDGVGKIEYYIFRGNNAVLHETLVDYGTPNNWCTACTMIVDTSFTAPSEPGYYETLIWVRNPDGAILGQDQADFTVEEEFQGCPNGGCDPWAPLWSITGGEVFSRSCYEYVQIGSNECDKQYGSPEYKYECDYGWHIAGEADNVDTMYSGGSDDHYCVRIDAGPSCTPQTEVCDGADNDCDGIIDEGSLCQSGYSCESGACVQDDASPPGDGNGGDGGDSGDTGDTGGDAFVVVEGGIEIVDIQIINGFPDKLDAYNPSTSPEDHKGRGGLDENEVGVRLTLKNPTSATRQDWFEVALYPKARYQSEVQSAVQLLPENCGKLDYYCKNDKNCETSFVQRGGADLAAGEEEYAPKDYLFSERFIPLEVPGPDSVFADGMSAYDENGDYYVIAYTYNMCHFADPANYKTFSFSSRPISVPYSGEVVTPPGGTGTDTGTGTGTGTGGTGTTPRGNYDDDEIINPGGKPGIPLSELDDFTLDLGTGSVGARMDELFRLYTDNDEPVCVRDSECITDNCIRGSKLDSAKSEEEDVYGIYNQALNEGTSALSTIWTEITEIVKGENELKYGLCVDDDGGKIGRFFDEIVEGIMEGFGVSKSTATIILFVGGFLILYSLTRR